jgi:serine/threonine-protein kinase
MPPEQAAGRSQDLGPATDVYSLGAILYELLCGRPPFQAESPVDTLLLVLRTEPVAPRLLNPGIHRDLETICLKCLEKDGRRRYASAQDLADDLGRFLANEPIHARRIGTAGRGWRWCRRNPWQSIAVAGLVLVALLATFSAFTWRDRLWRSMVEQARSERLAGNRARSLQLLAEAAQMKESDDLEQEAVQAITTPGLRPVVGRSPMPIGAK